MVVMCEWRVVGEGKENVLSDYTSYSPRSRAIYILNGDVLKIHSFFILSFSPYYLPPSPSSSVLFLFPTWKPRSNFIRYGSQISHLFLKNVELNR